MTDELIERCVEALSEAERDLAPLESPLIHEEWRYLLGVILPLIQSKYPHRDGEYVVIGPECFSDGDTVNWQGENYYREEVVRERVAAEIEFAIKTNSISARNEGFTIAAAIARKADHG